MKALGMVETKGLSCALESLDAMLKTAEVGYVGQKRVGSGFVTVLVDGDVAAVKAAKRSGTTEPTRVLTRTREEIRERFRASPPYGRRRGTNYSASCQPPRASATPADSHPYGRAADDCDGEMCNGFTRVVTPVEVPSMVRWTGVEARIHALKTL